MKEWIVCPLWNSKDNRFRSRHYIAWDRPCASRGRKVVVGEAVKREIESNRDAVLACEQCALLQADVPKSDPSEEADGPLDACETCQRLKEQEEAASLELARCRDLPDAAPAKAAYKKWVHVFRARLDHRVKAHNSEARGRG